MLDSDGDGRHELINMEQPVHAVNPPLPQPGWAGWGGARARATPSRAPCSTCGATRGYHFFGDLNRDGLDDSVLPYYRPPGATATLQVQLNSGNGFGTRQTVAPAAGYGAPDPIPGPLLTTGSGRRTSTTTAAKTCSSFHEGTPRARRHTHGLQLYLWRDTAFVRAPLTRHRLQASAIRDNRSSLDWTGTARCDTRPRQHRRRPEALFRRRGVPDQLIGSVTWPSVSGARSATRRWPTVPQHTPGHCTIRSLVLTAGWQIVAQHQVIS